jgi:hypothetical protein
MAHMMYMAAAERTRVERQTLLKMVSICSAKIPRMRSGSCAETVCSLEGLPGLPVPVSLLGRWLERCVVQRDDISCRRLCGRYSGMGDIRM